VVLITESVGKVIRCNHSNEQCLSVIFETWWSCELLFKWKSLGCFFFLLFSNTHKPHSWIWCPTSGLKVYFWLWEHLCYQVEISRHTAKILGAQLKMLGAQLKILVAPKSKIRKLQTLVKYSFISMLSFISILCLFLSGSYYMLKITLNTVTFFKSTFSISKSITLYGTFKITEKFHIHFLWH